MTRSPVAPTPAPPWTSRVSSVIVLVLVAVSSSVLLGRLLDSEWLHSPFGRGASLNVHSAAGFVVLAIALWRMPANHRTARVAYILLFLWGCLGVLQQAGYLPPVLDRLVGESGGPGARAMTSLHTHLATAWCCLLLGIGGALMVRGRGWPVAIGQGMVFVTGVIALVLVGGAQLDGSVDYGSSTVPSGIGFFIGALGVSLARRDHGLGRLSSRTTSPRGLRERALASMNVGVLIVDARLPDMPIVEANAAFERLTGYAAAEVVGRSCRFLDARTHVQEGLVTVRNALRDHRACDVVFEDHRKDGTPFWNQLAISPVLGADGVVTHFVAVMRDVSLDVADRAEREQLLAAAKNDQQEAERALGERDGFLGMVAHELRSPLHSARLWAAVLTDGSAKITPCEVAAHLIKSIDAQTRLVADLIDVSRAADAGFGLRLTVEDLRPLVATTIEHLAPLAAEKAVTIVTDLPDAAVRTRVDRDRFVQVLRRLVENAIKFTSADGAVRVGLSVDADRAMLQVADTGCGISKADLPHVFDKFWQSTKRKGRPPGLGLGLTIVRHLVEQHGGTIEVRSEGAGCGTSFLVGLPLVKQ